MKDFPYLYVISVLLIAASTSMLFHTAIAARNFLLALLVWLPVCYGLARFSYNMDVKLRIRRRARDVIRRTARSAARH